MLKYILLAVGLSGLVAFLVVRYVPSTRDYRVERQQAIAYADSLLRARDEVRLAKQEKDDLEAGIRRRQQRSDEQAALLLSTIQLQIQGLSAAAQRNEIIQRGLVRGLLATKDTLGPRTISYTQPENEATLSQLRECDAIEQRLRVTLESLTLSERSRGQVSDSLRATLRWINTSKTIEAWPGIPGLTGENRMQRAHVKTSPFTPVP